MRTRFFEDLTAAARRDPDIVLITADIGFRAASGACLRSLVPDGHLLTANARFESTTWTATMIGVDEPSRRLERFQAAIKAGQLLLMVDVPQAREQEIQQMVHEHFPQVDIEGGEPKTPIFP